MTRRAAVLVVAFVAAALVGVALLAVPGSPLEQRPTLGLDLQGGLEVTLQAVPPQDRKLTKEDLDRSVSIMDVSVNRIAVALVILGGLVGSSLIGVLASKGPHLLGLHLISVVGFVLSGVFGVWLLWGVVSAFGMRGLDHVRFRASVGETPRFSSSMNCARLRST